MSSHSDSQRLLHSTPLDTRRPANVALGLLLLRRRLLLRGRLLGSWLRWRRRRRRWGPWLAERSERLAAPLWRHVDAVDAVQRNAGPLVVVRIPRADPCPRSTGHGRGLTPIVRVDSGKLFAGSASCCCGIPRESSRDESKRVRRRRRQDLPLVQIKGRPLFSLLVSPSVQWQTACPLQCWSSAKDSVLVIWLAVSRSIIQGTFRAALKWQRQRRCADRPEASVVSVAERWLEHRRGVTQAEGEEKPRCAAGRARQGRWRRRARRFRPCHDWRVKELGAAAATQRSWSGRTIASARLAGSVEERKKELVPLISPADRRTRRRSSRRREMERVSRKQKGSVDARALLRFSLKRRAGLESSLSHRKPHPTFQERGSRAKLQLREAARSC